MDKEAILQELLARRKGKFALEDICFDKQIAFINDSSKLKVIRCGRRAGKTYANAVYLFKQALAIPKSTVIYLSITKDTAKSLIWNTFHDINNEFNLGAKLTESPPLVVFPNESRIIIGGADNEAEVRKARGYGFSLAIIDEVQNFRNNVLQNLIDSVLSKTLYDYDGTLVLSGTVPPVPIGYFWDCDEGVMKGAYKHFHWTMFDNPWIEKKSGKPAKKLLEQDLKRTGRTINDVTIRREVFAEWVTDTDALVFHYDRNINNYVEEPRLTEFVIGVDLGFDDADAIAVLGWDSSAPLVYLVEENIKRKQDITSLALVIEDLINKYKPVKVVMDTGGLGKKLAEELRKRYALPIEAAEKSRKFEYIELLNDALRTSKFHAKVSSQFAQDCMLVEWDHSNPQKLAIKETFHSDITDAVLYAYREALHWLYAPPKPVIGKQTPEWYKKIEEEMEENARKQIKSTADEVNPWGNGLEPSE